MNAILRIDFIILMVSNIVFCSFGTQKSRKMQKGSTYGAPKWEHQWDIKIINSGITRKK